MAFLKADHGAHEPGHAQHAWRERVPLQAQRPVARTKTCFAQLAVIVGALQPQRPQYALEVLAMPAGVARRLPARAGQHRARMVRGIGVQSLLYGSGRHTHHLATNSHLQSLEVDLHRCLTTQQPFNFPNDVGV